MRPGPMKAGETAFTRIPFGARSFAADFVSPITAAFDAEYAGMFGAPETPAVDAAAQLVQPRAGIRMVGKDNPMPALREHFGDRGPDVACGARDEDLRHSV